MYSVMKSWRAWCRIGVAAAAVGVLVGLGASGANAATVNVDCSANPTALASALTGATDGDTLTIQGTCIGAFEVAHSLTLAGSSGAILDGQGAFVVLTIDHGETVTVSGLRVTGGRHGVLNNGTLSLSGSTVTGNRAPVLPGGGIFSVGALSLTDSTVSDNAAVTGPGGGIFTFGPLSLVRTTVSNNSAGGSGGGIDIVNGSLTGSNTISDSTIRGNTAGSDGGGIDVGSFSNVMITGTTVTGNAARAGGGIVNTGLLSLSAVTVSGNSASAFGGGGISNGGGLTVSASTVSDNGANFGGGIANTSQFDAFDPHGAIANITNSTLSGNRATGGGSTDLEGDGGGLFNAQALALTSSTVSSNSASAGGGVFSESTTTLTSSIFAAAPSGGNCAGVGVVDGGYNLDDGTSCGFSSIAHSLAGSNALLDPTGLSDNGGPTKTVALLPGSPAIDAIPAGTNGCGTTITTDQRGITRPQGPGCDIGAFELVQQTPAQLLASLESTVQGVGPGTSLADKVTQTLAYLNSADTADACSTLTAFINELKAVSDKSITSTQAATLSAAAQHIRAVLSC